MERGEPSSSNRTSKMWQLECAEMGWALSASTDAAQVEDMKKFSYFLDYRPAEERPWMFFCLCFRSLWFCVRNHRIEEWMDAFKTYARRWVKSMSIDMVMDRAAKEGRFCMDSVVDLKQGRQVLMVLGFAYPCRLDDSRIPVCLKPSHMEWLISASTNPEGDRTMGMMLKQTGEEYGVVAEEWMESNVKLDFHIIDICRGATVSALYRRRRVDRLVASYVLQIAPVYRSIRPTRFLRRLLASRGQYENTGDDATMKLLHWNVRGVDSEYFEAVFLKLVADHRPDMVFLSETRVSRIRAWKMFSQFGFDYLCVADADGEVGGMALMWRDQNLDAAKTKNTDTFVQVIVEGKNPFL